MPQPVTIENDDLKMEVWPQIGGKISSLVDKADGFELLFNFPAELPTASLYDIPYSQSWYAGWDECCPAVGAGKYVGHPYEGINIPDHGELWGLPTTVVPTRNGITCVWNGLRFGYRLTRKLSLDGAALLAEYVLVNLAPFEFRFVWAMHALFSMDAPVELVRGAGAPQAFRLSHDAEHNDLHQPIEWPRCAGLDLSRPAGLPVGKAWKLYSQEPIQFPFTVRYPTRGRELRISYQSDDALPAYWGVWINTGGWAKHKHIGIHPTTGRFDELSRSTADRSAGTVGALARREWSVRFNVGTGGGR